MTGYTILVVHSDDVTLTGLPGVLTTLGYTVIGPVSSSQEALQRAVETHPDLVLVDIDFTDAQSGMDGLQVASQIHGQLDIPVVYMTGGTDEATLQRIQATVSYGYLIKPPRARDIRATVEMALHRHVLEQQLGKNERWLKAILRSISDAVLAADTDCRLMFMNPLAERLTGWSIEESIGRSMAEIFTIAHPKHHVEGDTNHHVEGDTEKQTDGGAVPGGERRGTKSRDRGDRDENDNSNAYDPIQVVQKGIAVGPLEGRLLPRNGDIQNAVWIEYTAAPIYDAREAIIGMIVIFRDITARHYQNLQQEIQYHLNKALSRTDDIPTALEHLLDTTLRLEEFDCGGAYLVDPHTRDLTLVAHRGLSPQFVESASYFKSHTPQSRIMQAGEPVYRRYADLLPDSKPDVRKEENLRSIAVIPISSGETGRVLAALNLASHTNDEISIPTRRIIEVILREASEALALLEAKAALQESRQNLRTLFNTADDLIAILDMDGALIDFNPALLERMGYLPDELYGKHITNAIPPEYQSSLRNILHRSDNDQVLTYRLPVVARDGTLIPLEAKISRGRWAGREALFIIARDVTKRLELEAELRKSLATLKAQYKNIPIPTYTWQKQGEHFVLSDYNDAAAAVTQGYIAHYLGMTAEEMYPDQPEIVEALAHCYTQKLPIQRETHSRHPTTDEHRNLVFRFAFVPPDLVLMHTEDVTERVQAEEALRESEEKFRTLSAAAQDAIIMINNQGKITFWNKAAERMFGYATQEAIGSTVHALIAPSDYRSDYEAGMARYATTGEGVVFGKLLEVVALRRDGSTFPVEMSISDVVMQGEHHAIAIIRDISKRKENERMLMATISELDAALLRANELTVAAESANRAKSTFLANMSHEIRTPLNGILGYAQILLMDPNLTERQREGLMIIQRSGQHLLNIINDILDLSKIEANKIEFHPTNFNLATFLDDLTAMIRVRADQKGLLFNYQPFDFEHDRPLTPEELADETGQYWPYAVQGNEKQLRQVLINLLGNAIKFTQAGYVTLKVGWAAQGESAPDECRDSTARVIERESAMPARKVRFQVEDTGIGIPADQLEAIFEPFQQVQYRHRQAEGTGLGLTISRRLVQMMGGELYVESTVGKGSTFWFEIKMPLVRSTSVEEEYTLPSTSPPAVAFEGPPRKILIVDDRAENRAMLNDLLRSLGFETAEAKNGQQAIEIATRWHPDAILMDLLMPTMDGFEATRRIRQIPALQKVVIIAISASALENEREKSLQAGCDAFVAKPIQMDQLLGQLGQHLNLTWIFAPTQEPADRAPTMEMAATEMTPPPPALLSTLYEHAMRGDLRALRREIERLVTADPQWQAFATEIRHLADAFQIDEICHLLETYLDVDDAIAVR